MAGLKVLLMAMMWDHKTMAHKKNPNDFIGGADVGCPDGLLDGLSAGWPGG